MSVQIVIEIQRIKISKTIWNNSKSRKVVAFAESIVKHKTFRSIDSVVDVGTQYVLPWHELTQTVNLYFYYIDALLTVEIGSCEYNVADDRKFVADGRNVTVIMDIKMNGSHERVGRVMCSLSVQSLFEDNKDHNQAAKLSRYLSDHRAGEFSLAVPDFRFKRLSRAVNWDRVRAFHMDRVVQTTDVRSVLACMDDVMAGDVTQEEVDPKLYKAMKLQQYSAQYLYSCHSMLKEKEKVVQQALHTFAREEELLDLKLSKMRARKKALQRESEECDRLCSSHTSLLRDLNPALMDDLYRTYRRRVDPLPHEERSRSPSELPRHQQSTRVLSVSNKSGMRHQQQSGGDGSDDEFSFHGRDRLMSTSPGHYGHKQATDRNKSNSESWQASRPLSPAEGLSLTSSTAATTKRHTHRKTDGWKVARQHEVDHSSGDEVSARAGSRPSVGLPAGPTSSSPDNENNSHSNSSSEGEEEEVTNNGGFRSVSRITSASSKAPASQPLSLPRGKISASPTIEEGSEDESAAVPLLPTTLHLTQPRELAPNIANNLRQSVMSTAMSVDSLAGQRHVEDDLQTFYKPPVVDAVVEKVDELKPHVSIVRREQTRSRSSSSSSDSETERNDLLPLRSQFVDNKRDAEQSLSVLDLSVSAMDMADIAPPKSSSPPSHLRNTAFKSEPLRGHKLADSDDSGRDHKMEYKHRQMQQDTYSQSDVSKQTPIQAAAEAKNDDTRVSRSVPQDSGAYSRYSDDDFDEDDPFSPSPVRQRQQQGGKGTFGNSGMDTFDSTGHNALELSTDIDTSHSVVIDFAFPNSSGAEKKKDSDVGLRTGLVNYLHREDSGGGKSKGEVLQSHDEDSDVLRLDRDASAGDEVNQMDSFGTLHRQSSADDDNVLLGTVRLHGTARQLPLSSKGVELSTTDLFDKDSLAGTGQLASPMLSAAMSGEQQLHRGASVGSPWNAVVQDTDEYDEDSYVSEEDAPLAAPDTPNPELKWVAGRAGVEAIELAEAFDVLVSAIRLDSEVIEENPEVSVSVTFLGVTCPRSSTIKMRNSSLQPVSFCTHMRVTDVNSDALRQEIREYEDALAFQISVMRVGSGDKQLLGQANVDLWVMIEDNCNILRQEVDILSPDATELVGSAVVDVRGYRLLKKYAN